MKFFVFIMALLCSLFSYADDVVNTSGSIKITLTINRNIVDIHHEDAGSYACFRNKEVRVSFYLDGLKLYSKSVNCSNYFSDQKGKFLLVSAE